ncbi:MAG: DUF4136 domain-containing protein [Steroidobacteraceae bacterium]
MNQAQRILPRSLVVAGLMLAAAILAAGCESAPPKPTSMRDPQANFAAFKTFGWDAAQDSQTTGQPLSLVDNDIRAAITSELKRKGYVEAAAGTTPDMVLRYETGKAEITKGSPFSIGVGVGSYGSSGGVGVGTSTSGTRNVTEGMLVLSVVDPVRKAEVWNGRVSRELGKNGTPNAALIRSAVADLLRDFPAQGSPPQ